jgi:hypothetical protein
LFRKLALESRRVFALGGGGERRQGDAVFEALSAADRDFYGFKLFAVNAGQNALDLYPLKFSRLFSRKQHSIKQ